MADDVLDPELITVWSDVPFKIWQLWPDDRLRIGWNSVNPKTDPGLPALRELCKPGITAQDCLDAVIELSKSGREFAPTPGVIYAAAKVIAESRSSKVQLRVLPDPEPELTPEQAAEARERWKQWKPVIEKELGELRRKSLSRPRFELPPFGEAEYEALRAQRGRSSGEGEA
jgi:hypothetical protein